MTPAEISQKLESLPAEISRASELAIQKWQIYQQAEEKLKTQRAKKMLSFKAEFPKSSVEILKARVDLDTEALRLETVVFEAEFKRAEKEVEKLDNEFTGAKRIGELLKTEMMSLNGSVRERK